MAAPDAVAPLGVFQSFIAQKPESLVLKERVLSLTGDSFSVKTVDGRELLQVKGQAFSLSGRKSVLDMQGNHLFDIRKKHLAISASFYAEDPQGKAFFEVVGKFSIMGSKSIGKFHNPFTNQDEELVIKGNFFDTSADIVNARTGLAVARIDRKMLNVSELFSNKQTYVVQVNQGVDLALIVAMCICLDERKNEK